MLETFSLICFPSLVLISLYSAVFIVQQYGQQQYAAAARELPQNTQIILVHANVPHLSENNQKNSTLGSAVQNSSTTSQKQEEVSAAIKNFQDAFCGVNITRASSTSNGYVTEFVLPQNCEMPLGTSVDNNDGKVWYVSTKNGVLGSYNLQLHKFDQEHIIPIWNSRQDRLGYSQVWSVQVNDSKQGGDVWFTDAQQNSIWRYIRQSGNFEIFKIPGISKSFGTVYPISLQFNAKRNEVFFVGTYSLSLWIGDISKMENGTSNGISNVPIPVDNATFKGIDPLYITTGSLVVDNRRNLVWVSVFSYGNKGEIFRYNLQSQSFDKRIDLPPELSSPVGMVVDDDNPGHLWITNGGSSIFYDLNTNNGNVVKFITSKISPRIFGQGLFGDIVQGKSDDNISDNISKNAYTLPYWIQKASDGSLWFNEQEGNKIGRFDPHGMNLIEYWIPSQNRVWGACSTNSDSGSTNVNDGINGSSNPKNIANIDNNNNNRSCGIANILQLSLTAQNKNKDKNNNGEESRMRHSGLHGHNQELQRQQNVWFTEWSENKIGKVDADENLLPFRVTTAPLTHKEITMKRGQSNEIKLKIIPSKSTSAISSLYDSMDVHMLASGTFTSTGDLGNSTGLFSEESFLMNTGHDVRSKHITFTFNPSLDLKPGRYVLMVGAENDAVSYLKAIKVRII